DDERRFERIGHAEDAAQNDESGNGDEEPRTSCDPAGRYLIFEQFPRDERAKTRPDRQCIVDRQRSDERARDGEHGSDEKRDSSATARQPRHDREIAKPDDDARHHVDGVVDAEHEAGETHYYDGDPGDDRTTSPG